MTVGVRYTRGPPSIKMVEISGDYSKSSIMRFLWVRVMDGNVRVDGGGAVILGRDFNNVHVGGKE